MTNLFKGKNILITGGTGFVGTALTRKLLDKDPRVIRIFSRDDTKQFNMRHAFNDDPRLRWLIGDIREKNRLLAALEDIDIVYNAAAIKHVPASEYNPFEAVKTNVIGIQNIIEAAIANNVDRVISMSTDKATNPSNVMGATKLLGEKLLASSSNRGGRRTKFASVRFGNVLGARGSVIPLFKQQLESGGPLTITHPDMQRFVITADQAIELVIRATQMTIGGEVFLFKMPVIKVEDLADVMQGMFAPDAVIERRYIGLRQGETLDEDLLTLEESMRSLETDDMFVILPTTEFDKTDFNHENARQVPEGFRYSSADQAPIPGDEFKQLLSRILF